MFEVGLLLWLVIVGVNILKWLVLVSCWVIFFYIVWDIKNGCSSRIGFFEFMCIGLCIELILKLVLLVL